MGQKQVSRQQLTELSAMFEIIQRQFPSGRIDRANFAKVFVNGDDAFAQRLWSSLDPQGTGFIDFREYALGASIFCVGSKLEKLQFLFSLCDQDGDGKVSQLEFNKIRDTVAKFAHTYMSALHDFEDHGSTEDRIRKEFNEADQTHDRMLSFEEFIKLFEKGEQEETGALHDLLESIEERLRLLFIPKKLLVRCALVGPAQCGKSSVIAELTKEEVGAVYRYNKDYNLDGIPVRLEIIDSGSNRAFAYPGVDIVIILYSVDSQDYSTLDEIDEEISSYCPRAVRIFALTKTNMKASGEAKYKAKEFCAQTAKKLKAIKAFQLAPIGGVKDSHSNLVTPEDLFQYAVSCVIPPFLLRPDHVHIRCGMAGPPGGGRSAMIGRLLGIGAITSHHYQANVDADGITAEVEISDSEEYNRALLLPRSHVIMLVVPVSCTNFKEVELIAGELRTICPDAPILLVGSKTDLRGTTKCIDFKKGEKWARQIRAWRYLECSASADSNIREVFQEAVRAAIPLFSLSDAGPLGYAHRKHAVIELEEGHVQSHPTADEQPLARKPATVTPTRGNHVQTSPMPPNATLHRLPLRRAPERPLPSPRDEGPQHSDWYVAQYDYLDDARAGVLPLHKFDVITVDEKREDGWWRGTLRNGSVGYFPGAYVLPVGPRE